MSGPTTVVLVDDHPMVREGVRHVLASAADISVVGEAPSVAYGRELAKRSRPDVVLLDLSLPDGDGMDMVEDLRARGAAVVVFSCHCGESYVRAAMRAGASGYLVKSAAPHEIIDAVRQAASGRVPLCAEAATCVVSALRGVERPGRPRLTEREREVWRLVADGLTNARIASKLFISEHTVKFHVHNLLRKLALRTRAEAICAAHKRGL